MKNLIVVIWTLLALSSSFATDLEKEIRLQKYKVEAATEQYQTLNEIAEDAEDLAHIATGVGIAAAIGWAQVPLLGEYSKYQLFRAYFAIRGMAATAMIYPVAGTFATPLLLGVVGVTETISIPLGLMVGAVLAHPESLYFIGKGIYYLVADEEEHEINIENIRNDRAKLSEIAIEVRTKMRLLIDNPPSTWDNSLSWGNDNKEHFAKIAQYAKSKVEIEEAILISLQAEQRLLTVE